MFGYGIWIGRYISGIIFVGCKDQLRDMGIRQLNWMVSRESRKKTNLMLSTHPTNTT